MELRIARVRDHLASFNAGTINAHGFYSESFDRRRDLSEAGHAIKEAVDIILNNYWPDADEADVAKALAVDTQLQQLRERCTFAIRDIIQSLRTTEKTINCDEDSPRRFEDIQNCFREIRKQIEAVDCIVYNRFIVAKSGLQ